ncbi:hypothetical protein QCA50_004501 [Cerrena zonata]|uniref:Uncharacterized protein n=1 Tax=Cerrena zonata TaxID=2478898 RepID=A0AAW0GTW5_9APHY
MCPAFMGRPVDQQNSVSLIKREPTPRHAAPDDPTKHGANLWRVQEYLPLKSTERLGSTLPQRYFLYRGCAHFKSMAKWVTYVRGDLTYGAKMSALAPSVLTL